MNRYLKAILARGKVYRDGATEAGDGGMSGAMASFASYLGGGDPSPAQAEPPKEESPEAAAERLVSEEANANQEQSKDGEQKVSQETQAPADEAVTFEVDGKPVTLTKTELAELHKSGLRQKDYTQKTQEVAETRKAAESEIQKAKTERDVYAQNLQQILMVNQHVEQQQTPWTQDMIESDPVGYLVYTQGKEARQQQSQAAYQELQRINQEHQQEREQSHRQYLQNQHQALLDKLPEWKDAAKMKAGLETLETFMGERGFNANDGPMVLDARVMLLANDAMKYRDLLARAATAGKKVNAAPTKVERPGVAEVKPTDGRTAAMKNLARSGSLDDAAAAFLQVLR